MNRHARIARIGGAGGLFEGGSGALRDVDEGMRLGNFDGPNVAPLDAAAAAHHRQEAARVCTVKAAPGHAEGDPFTSNRACAIALGPARAPGARGAVLGTV